MLTQSPVKIGHQAYRGKSQPLVAAHPSLPQLEVHVKEVMSQVHQIWSIKVIKESRQMSLLNCVSNLVTQTVHSVTYSECAQDLYGIN